MTCLDIDDVQEAEPTELAAQTPSQGQRHLALRQPGSAEAGAPPSPALSAASTCTSDWDSDDFEDALSIEPVASVSAIFSPPEQPVSQPWQGGLTSLAGRKVAALPRWHQRESGKENAAAKATVLLGFAPAPSVGSGKARLRGLRERARNGEAW